MEEAGQLAGCLIENGRRDLPGLRLVQRLRDLLADRLGAFRHTRAVSPVQLGDLLQDRNEAGAPVVVVFRREVRPPEEHLACGGEERRERPAALARERLYDALEAR